MNISNSDRWAANSCDKPRFCVNRDHLANFCRLAVKGRDYGNTYSCTWSYVLIYISEYIFISAGFAAVEFATGV
jgi:hypothetical protein